jgi:folate-binding protein YgfZ
MMPNDTSQYTALTIGTGIVELCGWTQIEITGKDRSTFLNNFCTNDIRRLQPGTGCEAFLTDVRGHTLTHAWVFCDRQALVLTMASPPAAEITAHLDRYIMREDVQLHDRSDQWAALLVAGATARETLAATTDASADLPQTQLGHVQAALEGHAVSIRQIDLAGPVGLLLQCEAPVAPAVIDALVASGATPCAEPAFEQVRIEAGVPLYGRDISQKNLPQEVGRNAQAISFSKGCYLGQETVARIASLGHVNRSLAGVRFSGSAIPPAGTQLTADGKAVGHVTSSAFSPRLECPLALAYLRTGHHLPGTRLSCSAGQAEVVTLPVTAE